MLKMSLNGILPHCIFVLALLMPFSVGAQADDSTSLQAQEPKLDNAVKKPKPTLNGSVIRYAPNGGAEDNNTRGESGGVDSSPAPASPSQPERPTLRGLGGGMFGFRRRLSAEEFRQLQYGIAGMVSFKFIFGKSSMVLKVFPGCPAEQAGIQRGDQIIRINDVENKRTDAQREFWNKVDGPAGTPVDITVLRHGQKITFHLIRMNIEDIPDDRLRREFEDLLQSLGAPHG